MSQLATTQTEVAAASDLGNPSAFLFDSMRMHALMDFADMMAKAHVTVPKHLQGKPADCLALTLQAMRWRMDPYVVAGKTHLVNGNLGYEAQLVVAVLGHRDMGLGHHVREVHQRVHAHRVEEEGRRVAEIRSGGDFRLGGGELGHQVLQVEEGWRRAVRRTQALSSTRIRSSSCSSFCRLLRM
jgi:hypothetical protein